MNPNQIFSPKQSELGLIQTESSIRINMNESEVVMIRIDSNWKFGRIDSDWKLGTDLFGLMPPIKSDWFFNVFYQTRYKTFFALVPKDSHWLGYRYRNESEHFWLAWNVFLFETFGKKDFRLLPDLFKLTIKQTFQILLKIHSYWFRIRSNWHLWELTDLIK